MIVPMTRYEFLLYHADVEKFLENLRQVGLVDITTTSWAGNDTERKLFSRSELLKTVVHAMRSVKPTAEQIAAAPKSVEQAVTLWQDSSARITALQSAIEKASIEQENLAIWGAFDVETLRKLKEIGAHIFFFECSNKDFQESWASQYALEVVNQTKNDTYFVVITAPGEPAVVNIPAIEVSAPQMSAEDKAAEIERLNKDLIEAIDNRAKAAALRAEIEKEEKNTIDKFEFSRVENAGEKFADNTIVLLEGWSEKANTAKIEAFAESQAVYFTSEKAKIENNPPVKLKNTFFARLYEPIGNLYMLPRYDELDMTPFFAPFFMIFFGMCLGDAAYGLLFILGIVVMWKKIPAKFKDFGWLGIFLSLSGIVFGLLSGNFGGIELFKIDALAELRRFMLLRDPNTVFYFAVALGGVQVLFGQFLRIINRIKRGGKFIYGVSSIGWFSLFVSSIVAVLLEQTDQLWYYITLGATGCMILFFANPAANIFASTGKGLYSVYEMATGIVGDLISYVRLFAIGLAGAIIAQVFNELAIGLSGDIIVVKQLVMLIILVIGHGLNIFISALGAFVHPVRLTFVEFFKNAEFEGGSRPFKPLKKAE